MYLQITLSVHEWNRFEKEFLKKKQEEE